MNIVRSLKRALRVVLPLGILTVGFLWAQNILDNPPEAQTQSAPAAIAQVAVSPLRRGSFQVQLRSQGTVQAQTQSLLGAEVAGRVIRIAPAFAEGAAFDSGEVLVELDPSAYLVELELLEAEASQARALLAELAAESLNVHASLALADEEVRLQTSRLERSRRLARGGASSDAVVEEAQLAELAARTRRQTLHNQLNLLQARRARLSSGLELTDARRKAALLDLAHTRICAPFAGRVLRRHVDLGQYVSPGSTLATVFASAGVEVRLPLNQGQLAWLDLPVAFQDDATLPAASSNVLLQAGTGALLQRWDATLVRSDAALDTESRQLFVVAAVDGHASPWVGMFVQAQIAGRSLDNVLVVPREALRGADELLLVRRGMLRRQTVEVLWKDATVAVIGAGVDDDDLLCTTPLVFAGESIEVKTEGTPEEQP